MTDTINSERYIAEHGGVVDLAKLAEPHQRVVVHHTGSPPNPQVLFDRQGERHILQAGEVKEIDLTVSMIERLRELRRPGRMIEAVGQEGELYNMKRGVEAPLHPLLIKDLPQP